MEYPGLTFIGHYGDEFTHDLYGVIAHEIAHTWSPLMMGTNEMVHRMFRSLFLGMQTLPSAAWVPIR